MKQWQELATLQGIGYPDWYDYSMDKESDALMRSFIGNSFMA